MIRLPRTLPNISPVAAQLASVVVGGVIVVGIALVTSNVVERHSLRASEESDAALLTSRIAAQVDAVAVLGLDKAVEGPAAGAPPASGAAAGIALSDAIAAHDALLKANELGEELHVLIGSDVTLQMWGATGEASSAIDQYLQAPTQKHFDDLQIRLRALRTLAAFQLPLLTQSAQRNQTTLRSASSVARIATILAALASTAGVALATLVLGRRLRGALQSAEQEKRRLVDASSVMQRRNDQFAALYQVVSEVTESLNMRYVVRTTLREARKLVNADVVALRRLDKDQLVVAGTEQDIDGDVEALTTVSLGTGVVGRAAKRGKTIRIDAQAYRTMVDGERISGMESGIVVPLIVGARVVGTLSCWSRVPEKFSVDDERILEMMASQVATAVTAADLHEATDHDAHHDALTGLPNRRQLNEDIKGRLEILVENGSAAAIAMVDIDHFKRFNDDFGHRIGDITLQRVAQTLRASVRERDRVYRFGGEEFVVVFAGATREEGLGLAERLRVAVSETLLTGERSEPIGSVTVSIGLALSPTHGTDLNALIDLADRAMYASKEMGRDRVTLCGEEPEELRRAA